MHLGSSIGLPFGLYVTPGPVRTVTRIPKLVHSRLQIPYKYIPSVQMDRYNYYYTNFTFSL